MQTNIIKDLFRGGLIDRKFPMDNDPVTGLSSVSVIEPFQSTHKSSIWTLFFFYFLYPNGAEP